MALAAVQQVVPVVLSGRASCVDEFGRIDDTHDIDVIPGARLKVASLLNERNILDHL